MPDQFRTDPSSMEPLIPSTRLPELQDLAWKLGTESHALGGTLHPRSRDAVAHLLRIVNSYYSNLIEGHETLPADIERAYRRDFSADPQQRDLQIEAKAHVEIERRMRIRLRGANAPRITDPAFLSWIHDSFFSHLPSSMWTVTSAAGQQRTIIPGKLRDDQVVVGDHEPPDFTALQRFMERFDEAYRPDRLTGPDRVIAAAASHHRLLWIHPYLDGNGRVARLFTEAFLMAAGVDSTGLWSVSRGLARQQATYKALLAAADDERRGATDGRGPLSDQALANFCVFFLEQALDQVRFIRGLIDPDGLHDRVWAYVSAEAAAGRLPRKSPELILQLLIRGSLERGEALKILGGAERTARSHLSRLLDLGMVAPDGISHKSGIRWSIPVAAGAAYFPLLFPSLPGQALAAAAEPPTFIETLRILSDQDLLYAIDELLAEQIHELEGTEEVGSAMAETNATGFYPDDYTFSLDDIDLFDDHEGRIRFTFHLSGEHDMDSDRMFSGDEIEGGAVLVIDANGECSFEEISAGRVEYPPEEEDDYEPPEALDGQPGVQIDPESSEF